jgi:hypothetical protein
VNPQLPTNFPVPSVERKIAYFVIVILAINIIGRKKIAYLVLDSSPQSLQPWGTTMLLRSQYE